VTRIRGAGASTESCAMALAAPRILTCFEGPTSSFHSLFTIHTLKSKMSLYPLAALAAILSAASLDLLKPRTSLAAWAARGLTNGESPQVGDQDQYIHVSSHWRNGKRRVDRCLVRLLCSIPLLA
jgi:hypothetical protein